MGFFKFLIILALFTDRGKVLATHTQNYRSGILALYLVILKLIIGVVSSSFLVDVPSFFWIILLNNFILKWIVLLATNSTLNSTAISQGSSPSADTLYALPASKFSSYRVASVLLANWLPYKTVWSSSAPSITAYSICKIKILTTLWQRISSVS